LAAGAKTLKPEKVSEYAEDVQTSAKQVFKLLENLLDWSRMQMQGAEVDFQETDARDAIERNLELFSTAAAIKRIELVREDMDPQYVLADPSMLDFVLRNLIHNAIKFTKKQGRVTVKMCCENSYVHIEVVDTGVGISKERLTNLFRLDQQTSTQGTSGEVGTGLGLHLCKEEVPRKIERQE